MTGGKRPLLMSVISIFLPLNAAPLPRSVGLTSCAGHRVATANITATTAVTKRVIDFIGVSSRVGSDAQHDNSVQCIPCHAVSLHRTPRFFKRHEYGKRHGSLDQTGTSFAAASLKIAAKVLRSPEDLIRDSPRTLVSGNDSPTVRSEPRRALL